MRIADANTNTTATPSCTPGWVAGPDLPSVGVRMVGVYFPANGKFYAMGGRSADTAGSDFTHPFEYDPGTNTWTTKAATYPDNQVNNMACGVLTDAGTPYIYCVGGSAAGATMATGRVFRYNPVTDTISAVAAPWPQGGSTLCLVASRSSRTSSTSWADSTSAEGCRPTRSGSSPRGPTPGCRRLLFCLLRSATYRPRPSAPSSTRVEAPSIAAGLLTDDSDSFVYNPVADTISTIANIPRPTGETRALNVNNKMWVMGGGRTAPNPSNEVDIYDPVAGTWSMGTPFTTARRNFPTDTDGSSHIWLAGGYDTNGIPTASMEIFGGGGPRRHRRLQRRQAARQVRSTCSSCIPTDGSANSASVADPGRTGVTAVDLFDAQAGTPTLAQLQQYQIVVPYSNFPFLDADTLGNNLADYVDGGGVVVQYGFSHLARGSRTESTADG